MKKYIIYVIILIINKIFLFIKTLIKKNSNIYIKILQILI